MNRSRALRGAATVLTCGLLATLVPIAGAAPTSGVPAAAQVAGPAEKVWVYKSSPSDPVGAARAYADMMRIPSTDTGFRSSAWGPLNDLEAACPVKRCRDFDLKVPAGVKVTSSMVRVLYPRGYFKKKNRHKRYPVAFVFNGARSPYTTWSRKSRITSISRSMDAIFVFPEGGYGADAGMFSDWVDGSYDWETFHTKVMVPWADRALRTKKGARVAVGASMGSLGALNYAAHNPGMFKSVLSMSGMVDNTLLTANALPPDVAKAAGIYPPDLNRVWGSPVLNRANWDAHNPAALVGDLKGVKLFITCGTGFLTGDYSDAVHSGYAEWLMWQAHRTLLGALTRAGVPFQARISQGNIHDYPYFDRTFRWGLPRAIAAARH